MNLHIIKVKVKAKPLMCPEYHKFDTKLQPPNWNVETLSVIWSFTNTSLFPIPVQVWADPLGSRLSAPHPGCLYPRDIPGTHCWYRLSRCQAHSVAGRIMSMKNSNDTVGNQTCDLQACSSVPQPTVPPSAPTNTHYSIYICQHSLW